MIEQNLQQFVNDASNCKTIPMSRTIFADMTTPIQLFQLFDDRAAFILESHDEKSIWSNYSFIGIDPTHVLIEHNGKFSFETIDGQQIYESDRMQDIWNKCHDHFQLSSNIPDIPFPGGAVGYFTFEAYSLYEPKVSRDDTEGSKVCLLFCETILAFDHEKEQLTIIYYKQVGSEPKVDFYHGSKHLENLIEKIKHGSPNTPSIFQSESSVNEDLFLNVQSNETKHSFIEKVNKVKKYIVAGDVFQTVLSQRFSIPVKSSGIDLYRVLRKVNPSPYLYYLRLGSEEIIGSSPERLVKIEACGELEIHPIAGTRPRGKSKEEDEALALDLKNDEKEKAEHLMLVDLARNDIGKVSKPGTVQVKDFMTMTYFSHVMHLITKVYGQMSEKVSPFEALFSSHPAGTVSGAPKVRAVEIIQELEEEKRGVYAGAIAYCGWNGAIDSCIAIRTMILKDGVVSIQAGAGIVHDSNPEAEYEETKNKAKALLYAVKLAEKRFEQGEADENGKCVKELTK
ncbi:chorismate-binding protein [Bacillus shivajii]|uniref:anthranilate synthase component I family protein n=1 Tax=Bacillus shivajii TaxID=1983719 RepID=UPI001CFC2DDF|nr:chorismate-binding protein [Bacillus shivajii]UCZ54782.1 chorismate-binding protein [Bacillus shivajii]